jgi:TPR repeat protein
MRTIPSFVAVLVAAAFVGAASEPLQDAAAAILRKDYANAAQLLRPLAEGGNAVAQLRLGELYYHGHGVAEDDLQARHWFERAARQGLADAQFHLGNMYAYGQAPVPEGTDPARVAAQWYFEAARQGHADAQYSLGILFLTGSGVLASEAEAERWIGRAAAAGHADARAYMAGRIVR